MLSEADTIGLPCRRRWFACAKGESVVHMSNSPLWKASVWSLLGIVLACSQRTISAPPEPKGNTQPAVVPTRPSAPPSAEADPKATCLAAAQACGRHVIVDDYEGIVSCMPDEAIKMLGGRGTIIDMMRKGNAEMARGGARFEQSLIDPPSEVSKGDKRTFAILPQVTVVRVPEGLLRQRAFLLAVSPDDGHTWKFVDGVKLNRELARRLFPDFPSSLTLPHVGQPELAATDK
jgi:hypothetical protein